MSKTLGATCNRCEKPIDPATVGRTQRVARYPIGRRQTLGIGKAVTDKPQDVLMTIVVEVPRGVDLCAECLKATFETAIESVRERYVLGRALVSAA